MDPKMRPFLKPLFHHKFEPFFQKTRDIRAQNEKARKKAIFDPDFRVFWCFVKKGQKWPFWGVWGSKMAIFGVFEILGGLKSLFST